ncbi:MAG: HDOD domain-containing protein [Leptospiraceae bacterium]|nr:HDOD domain-containing protein [Leptospiraceae bacterium]MCP5495261.1 HDOD domain-containing protein [Leptospiraceae bacterium]
MLDIEELSSHFFKEGSFSVEFKFFNDEVNQDIYSLLVKILSQFDQLFLIEVLNTILKEIITNSVKANAKRLFFEREKLDIFNSKDYSKGMKDFHSEVTFKWSEQEDILSNSIYYVKFMGGVKDEIVYFLVENNVGILPDELKRIQSRLECAKKYNDLSDAFLDMGDTQESAGLGLILTQILLKNSGVGIKNFKIESNEAKTLVSLNVPRNTVPIIVNNKFNEKILNEIESLPPLQERITRLITLCNNPETTIQKLSGEIEKDPALSAELLKLSNSTLFSTRNKVATISMAIRILGIQNIKNVLYASEVRKILAAKYKRIQSVWDHSYKCSFFAKQVGVDHSRAKISELAATGGLLHDIGKLILLSLDKELVAQIDKLKLKEKSSSVVVEEMSVGIGHPEIGAKLAGKWGFPEELVTIIQYHHRPMLAPEKYKDLVEVVYLANIMVDTLDDKASYYTVEQETLKAFKLDSEESYKKYIEKLNALYQSNTVE